MDGFRNSEFQADFRTFSLPTTIMAGQKRISAQEVLKHCTASDCWLVIDNKIWDFTEFASVHPGGEAGKSTRTRPVHFILPRAHSYPPICWP